MLTTPSGPILKPAFKVDVRPLLRTDGSIWVGTVYGLASEIRDESGLVWPLCGLLDGVRPMFQRHDSSAGGSARSRRQ